MDYGVGTALETGCGSQRAPPPLTSSAVQFRQRGALAWLGVSSASRMMAGCSVGKGCLKVLGDQGLARVKLLRRNNEGQVQKMSDLGVWIAALYIK